MGIKTLIHHGTGSVQGESCFLSVCRSFMDFSTLVYLMSYMYMYLNMCKQILSIEDSKTAIN